MDATASLKLDQVLGTTADNAGSSDKALRAEAPGTARKPSSHFDEPALQHLPELVGGVDVQRALEQAYGKAAAYMNDKLADDGLEVAVAQQDGAYVGQVTDRHTGEVKQTYDGQQLLKLFAHNHGRRGIVIDGRV